MFFYGKCNFITSLKRDIDLIQYFDYIVLLKRKRFATQTQTRVTFRVLIFFCYNDSVESFKTFLCLASDLVLTND